MKTCTIRIAGLLWEINIVPAGSPELYVDNISCNGTTWFTQQRIYLSADISEHAVVRTIMHELTHAYIYATQMKLPDTFTEEEVCNFFGRWGQQIVSDSEYILTQLYNK